MSDHDMALVSSRVVCNGVPPNLPARPAVRDVGTNEPMVMQLLCCNLVVPPEEKEDDDKQRIVQSDSLCMALEALGDPPDEYRLYGACVDGADMLARVQHYAFGMYARTTEWYEVQVDVKAPAPAYVEQEALYPRHALPHDINAFGVGLAMALLGRQMDTVCRVVTDAMLRGERVPLWTYRLLDPLCDKLASNDESEYRKRQAIKEALRNQLHRDVCDAVDMLLRREAARGEAACESRQDLMIDTPWFPLCALRHVKRNELRGYRGKDPYEFYYVATRTNRARRDAAKLLMDGSRELDKVRYSSRESDTNPVVDLMVTSHAAGFAWLCIAGSHMQARVSTCAYEMCCVVSGIHRMTDEEMQQLQLPPFAPIMLTSFDIEATPRKKQFPRAHADPTITFGFSTHDLSRGSKAPPVHNAVISVLSTHAVHDDGIDVDTVWTTCELRAILLFVHTLRALGTYVLTGWYINGFDIEYVVNRLRTLARLAASPVRDGVNDRRSDEDAVLNSHYVSHARLHRRCPARDHVCVDPADALRSIADALRFLSRQREHEVSVYGSTFQTKAFGKHERRRLNCPGLLVWDALETDKKDFRKRGSHKLAAVAAEDLGGMTKLDMPYDEITDAFRNGIDSRTLIAVYCFRDALLVLRVVLKTQREVIWSRLSIVTRLPLDVLLNQGETVRVVTLLLYYARSRDIVLPQRTRYRTLHDAARGQYEGAYVWTPRRGFYSGARPALGELPAPKPLPMAPDTSIVLRPVTLDVPREAVETPVPTVGGQVIHTLDFASLYPSIMMAYYISYVSQLLHGGSPRELDELALLDLTPAGFAMRASRGLAQPRTVSDASHAREPALVALAVSSGGPSDVERAPNAGAAFVAQHIKRGALPEVLEGLLTARKQAKREMAAAFAAGDATLGAIKNGQQNGLKVTANGTYGVTGASKSPLAGGDGPEAACRLVSPAVTQTGRRCDLETAYLVRQYTRRGALVPRLGDLRAWLAWQRAYMQRIKEALPLMENDVRAAVRHVDATSVDRAYSERVVSLRMPANVAGVRAPWTHFPDPWASEYLTRWGSLWTRYHERRLLHERRDTTLCGKALERFESHLHGIFNDDDARALADLCTVHGTAVPGPPPPDIWAPRYPPRDGARDAETDETLVLRDAHVAWLRAYQQARLAEDKAQVARLEDEMPNDMRFACSAMVVYGDTDSIMVHSNESRLAAHYGMDVALAMSSLLGEIHELLCNVFYACRAPMGMEFEYFSTSALYIEKKRYTGLKFKPWYVVPEKQDNSHGLEIVRLDWTPMTRRLLQRVLDTFLRDHGSANARKRIYEMVAEQVAQLAEGRVSMSDLVMSKQLSKNTDEYTANKPVHVALIERRRARGDIELPSTGERVYFVFVKGAKGAKRGECAEDPLYALEHNIQLDTDYYIAKQVLKPVARMLEVVFSADELARLSRITRRVEHVSHAAGPMGRFLAGGAGANKTGFAVTMRQRCRVCNAALPEGCAVACRTAECRRVLRERRAETVAALTAAQARVTANRDTCERCMLRGAPVPAQSSIAWTQMDASIRACQSMTCATRFARVEDARRAETIAHSLMPDIEAIVEEDVVVAPLVDTASRGVKRVARESAPDAAPPAKRKRQSQISAFFARPSTDE